MTFHKSVLAGALTCFITSTAVFAQAAAPAPAAPAATTPAAPAIGMDKKAVSKACSDEATKQNLHGKARKAYRSKCKMEKMKAM